MYFISILYFLVVSYCLGFTITSFVRNNDHFLERNIMRFGFGMSLMPLIGMILNLIRLPADWRIILILSLIYPLYYLGKNFSSIKDNIASNLKLTSSDLYALGALLIFLASAYIYISGAFSYPFLENDDSWGHAEGLKYVSMEKEVYSDQAVIVRYMNPYPPTYDLLLGIIQQTNESVYWTLKFFNGLIVASAVLFFFFFVREFSNNRKLALFATFCLASIPAFLSHFIWALALTMPLYFVTFYAIEQINYDKKWWIVSGLVMFTTLTSSPTHSTYFGVFFILYFLVRSIVEKKILVYEALAGLLGIASSFLIWWLPMILKHGVAGTLQGIGFRAGHGAASFGGTGDRAYTLGDFLFAKHQNMINNPVGVGLVLSLLAIIGVVFLIIKYKEIIEKRHYWLFVTFIWFLFTLYAVNAAKMPIKLSPFRAWMIFAIKEDLRSEGVPPPM